MQPFNQLTTTATPLRRENVDTDQIIPARYLTVVTKAGMGGRSLFPGGVMAETANPTRTSS